MDPERVRSELRGLERQFRRLDPPARRTLALDLAQAAGATVDVPREELDAAVAATRAGWLGVDCNALAAAIATDARRLAVRMWAADLSVATRDGFPAFAAAFEELAREPLQDDVQADELWLHAVLGLVVGELFDGIGTDA